MNITAEAVEAALEAFWDNEDEPITTGMKRALEAAAPQMLAGERGAARNSREHARKLEAVTSIAVRLEGSTQSKDRQLAEELYAAIGLT